MRALRLQQWTKDPELCEVPVPEPGPGEVLIKIGGAGACHSDLHVMDWPAGDLPWLTPFTMGHENAGWVEKLGPGVEGFAPGDPVVVYGHWGCGWCRACREGIENYCENAATFNGGAEGGGLGLDGGMAEYMLVPSSRHLVPLTTIEPRDAAPLTDAGLTPYLAIKYSLDLLGPGSSAVVIGVGGLGHMAIQILRALSAAQVIGVDISKEKLLLACQVGADHTIVSDQCAGSSIRELTRGRGADLVLDTVGSEATIELAMSSASVRSKVVVIGIARGTFTWQFGKVPFESWLGSSYWGSIPELFEVVALAESGRLRSSNSFHSLESFADVYAAMRAGKLVGRAVLVPGLTKEKRIGGN